MVDNAFGILANHFRCLLTTMVQESYNVNVVLACVTLYNIIRRRYWADHQGIVDEEDNNYGQVPGGKVKFCQTLGNHIRGKRPQLQLRQKEYLMHYYNNSVLAVPWQNDNLIQGYL